MPLIEFLLLLLLLLRATLLYRRHRANQRMRRLRSRPHLLLLRWPEVAIRRLGSTIFLRLWIPVLRLLRAAILGLRSSLLLVDPRLRLRHLPDLIVAAVGRAKRFEAVLRRWVGRLDSFGRAGLGASDAPELPDSDVHPPAFAAARSGAVAAEAS